MSIKADLDKQTIKLPKIHDPVKFKHRFTIKSWYRYATAASCRMDCIKKLKYNKKMEIIIDANIVMAVILNEPTKPKIIEATGDVSLVSTEIIWHEVVNALSSLYRRKN
ncbi:hypothetical protein FACS1894172_03660 [Spirochaetia bacterium]|nr:hypothetical protein FACS1894172_03660 [Spirochaetia bacterium]